MTVKEFIEQLQQFPEDMEIKCLHVSPKGIGFYAEPVLFPGNDKILIVNGKLELITYA